MKKQKRYLITTADEGTWKFNQPVIFLGEWCRLYSRKHVWEKLDSVVAKPYGLGSLKKDSDYLYTKKIEEKIFPELCRLLNEYHGSQHDERFWNIIIGHWFKSIVQLLLNRINTLTQCFQQENINETMLYKSEYCSLASPDWSSAFVSFNSDQWNNILYGRIMSLLDNINISINYYEKNDKLISYQDLNKKIFNKKLSFNRMIKKNLQLIYSQISKRFVKNEDALIINTYLPFLEEKKLEMALGQFPQIWINNLPEINVKPDQILRKNLSSQLMFNSENELERIIKQLIFELLPVYYLEAQKDLKKIINIQNWPKTPRFIFTSNNFYMDEVFKLWTAIKVESGSKYYIGQHGNNYFTTKNLFPRVEEKTSDKFFTWGWTNGLSKYIPTFNFKIAGKKKLNYNSKGRLLLIETTQKVRFATWDSTSEHNEYFKDQMKFISKLDIAPRQKLIIRLSHLYKKRKFYDDLRWYDFDKTIKIDDGKKKLHHLIADSRLVVHSYDSTGILETLSQNIPTLAFWQNDLEHLREEVKPIYQLLIDVGIVHLSSESISSKVNQIWDKVDEWWNENDIQEARKFFCNKLSKDCKNPTRELISLLT